MLININHLASCQNTDDDRLTGVELEASNISDRLLHNEDECSVGGGGVTQWKTIFRSYSDLSVLYVNYKMSNKQL